MSEQDEIEIHPEFIAIWHKALADIIQMEKSFANFASVEVSEDVIVKKPDNSYQLTSCVAGKSVVIDIPKHFWRLKRLNAEPWFNAHMNNHIFSEKIAGSA